MAQRRRFNYRRRSQVSAFAEGSAEALRHTRSPPREERGGHVARLSLAAAASHLPAVRRLEDELLRARKERAICNVVRSGGECPKIAGGRYGMCQPSSPLNAESFDLAPSPPLMNEQVDRCPWSNRVEPPFSHGSSPSLPDEQSHCKCQQHRSQSLRFFCQSCNLAICLDCTLVDHVSPAHQVEPIEKVAEKQMALMEQLISNARNKQQELLEMFKMVDAAQQRLTLSLHRAHQNIEDNTQTLIRLIEDNRRSVMKDLDNAFGAKQLQLTVIDKKIQEMTEKLSQTIEFTQHLVKYSSPTEVMAFKHLLDSRMQVFLEYNADNNNLLNTPCEVEIPVVNTNHARQTLLSLLGTIRGGSDWQIGGNGLSSVQAGMPPTPIGRPPSRMRSPISGNSTNIAASAPIGGFAGLDAANSLLRPKHDFGGSSQSLGPFTNTTEAVPASHSFPHKYTEWSSGLEPTIGSLGLDSLDLDGSSAVDKNAATANGLYPPRSQIKRQKMIYHCKFGEFGVMEGQFTEPSGVAVNAQNDIVVADTNNHRIQVFDKEGRFKFQFGECGKRDGQLLYPNRVAVNRVTGDFIVTERSPTHQIQVYNQYGQFLRKFGANILQHPRGVCVDNEGRIIVVECKVMRVIIFDSYGNILQKFSCSRYLEFPNGVCTNDKREILISDNRAHCIKVFNYEGLFVRQIGGEGITNYPIGVGINSMGEVVVADNHNNFNLTVFSQDGTMLSALESKVKHAQCFDVALVEDGSVVLASKDYRLYLYRYQMAGQL
uniref:B box-type domain-containing protein n=1 Tax=Steinernema glaseri TaxID=37863 RepID=A0A1I7ZGG5_9BILA